MANPTDEEEISLDNLEDLLTELGDGEKVEFASLEMLENPPKEETPLDLAPPLEEGPKPLISPQVFDRFGKLKPFMVAFVDKIDEVLYFLGWLEIQVKTAIPRLVAFLKKVNPKETIQLWKSRVQGLVGWILSYIGKAFDLFSYALVHMNLKLIFIWGTLLGGTGLGVSALHSKFHRFIWTVPVQGSLLSRADEVFLLDLNDSPIWDKLFGTPVFAAFDYKFDKFIVNIKTADPERASLVALEVIVQTTSLEAVDEITKQKSYFSDLMQTEFLDISPEELSSTEGVLQLRKRLQELLNEELKTGKVIQVLYNLILVKP